MEMNEYASLQIPDQVNLPFAISFLNDNVLLCTKANVEILKLKYKHINEDGALNYILSRFECSKEKPTGQLSAKEIEIYNSSSRMDRTKIMLDQTIIPNIATVYINNVTAAMSPPGIFPDSTIYLVAHLTNMGQLSMQKYDALLKDWILYMDISKMWNAHLNDSNVYKKLDKLLPAVHDALITSFCWREHVFQKMAYFAIGTKSGRIALYSLLSDGVQVRFLAVVSQPVRTLKWITVAEDRNLLLVGLSNGNLAMYVFRTLPDGSVVDFEQLNNLWSDEDNLIVGDVKYEMDYANNRLLILIVKGMHLVAFLCDLKGELKSMAMHNVNHFMITGIEQLSPYSYIVCTLPGEVFCINIKIKPNEQLEMDRISIKTDLNLSKYSIYGVTASRNRSCWLFVGYPSKSFDRLSLRTPTVIFFCTFNECDPIQILLNNPTLRLTNYYDCAEVIRCSGNRNTQVVKVLEQMASNCANVDDSYAYHLKLQLIQLGARFSHYKRRSQQVAEVLYNQSEFLKYVIEVLHATKVIYYFMHVRHALSQLSYHQLLTIRCLRNFIEEFLTDTFPGDYEHVHLSLKPPMKEVIARANELLATTDQELYAEECTFCGDAIPEAKQTCVNNHQTFRCSITKQQIAFQSEETVCELCDRSALDVQLLSEIFCADGGQLNIYYSYCYLCDMPFHKHGTP